MQSIGVKRLEAKYLLFVSTFINDSKKANILKLKNQTIEDYAYLTAHKMRILLTKIEK